MSKYIDIDGLRHYNEKVIEKINNSVPTKISQLTNDSNYITNEVNNLGNYYSKSETYTKTEVDNAIACLVDSAPDALNTLNELATAIQENDSVIDTLNSAIGIKANQSDLDITNSTIETLSETVANNKTELDSKIPTNISQLNNDSGYITSYTETDPTVPSHVKNITEANITSWNNKVEQSDLNGLATETYVNTQISNLVDSAPDTLNTLNELATAINSNSSVIETLNNAISSKAEKSALDNYSLTTHNHDTIYSKLSHSHAYAEITGTPTLATVATSGSYNDLTNKPTIPDTSSFITKDVNNLTNYTTTTSLNTLLSGKASSSHTHSYNDLNDLPSTLNITSTQIILTEVD